MNEQIVVTIDKTGKTSVSVNGCTGASCSDLTRALEKALGSTVTDKKKMEFYENHAQQNATNSY